MEFRKRHSQSYFYKYTKASTAKLILEKGFFLSKCPLKFNDPFDIQIGLLYGFDFQKLPEMFYEKLVSLIEAESDPEFTSKNDVSVFVMKLRASKKTVHISHEKLRREIETAPRIAKMIAFMEASRLQFVNQREKLVKRMRVLCLSTEHDNVLMWSHYADEHTGVVFKLKVAEAESDDDPLWLAQEVTYTPEAIPLLTSEEALDQMFGIAKYDAGKLSKQLECTKFDVWKHENEYRVCDWANEEDNSDYFIGVSLKRFEAIYFGVKSDEKTMQEIKKLAQSKNDAIEFYWARKHPCEYKLQFERI